jgi:hypothetical protein
LGKPGHPKELLPLARALKEAGLALGLILMVGAGGRTYEKAHREESLSLLAELPLGREDLVYLSPFQETPGTPTPLWAWSLCRTWRRSLPYGRRPSARWG